MKIFFYPFTAVVRVKQMIFKFAIFYDLSLFPQYHN